MSHAVTTMRRCAWKSRSRRCSKCRQQLLGKPAANHAIGGAVGAPRATSPTATRGGPTGSWSSRSQMHRQQPRQKQLIASQRRSPVTAMGMPRQRRDSGQPHEPCGGGQGGCGRPRSRAVPSNLQSPVGQAQPCASWRRTSGMPSAWTCRKGDTSFQRDAAAPRMRMLVHDKEGPTHGLLSSHRGHNHGVMTSMPFQVGPPAAGGCSGQGPRQPPCAAAAAQRLPAARCVLLVPAAAGRQPPQSAVCVARHHVRSLSALTWRGMTQVCLRCRIFFLSSSRTQVQAVTA